LALNSFFGVTKIWCQNFHSNLRNFKVLKICTRNQLVKIDHIFNEKKNGLMWLVISSAHNLITVVQTVKRKLHTTLNNICMVLTSTRIEPELSESLNIQFVMSTFPLYQRFLMIVSKIVRSLLPRNTLGTSSELFMNS
jgi:hypothetical protein